MTGRSAFAVTLLPAVVLAGCGGSAPTALATTTRPLRVMSMSQCTDQLVLALLPPARIASVTWLSRDPRFSAEAGAAMRVPINHGGVEEVARTRPDLIVTDTFSNPGGRALLRRLGYPMIEVADAASVADIRRNVRTVAAAVGERARGEALIAGMDRALAVPPDAPRERIRVAAWDRDGMGAGTMLDTILAAAGAIDVGTRGGDVEDLLVAAPTLLVERTSGAPSASLGDNRADHPIVRARWNRDRRLRVPEADLFCATPAIGKAALSLRAQVMAYRQGSRT